MGNSGTEKGRGVILARLISSDDITKIEKHRLLIVLIYTTCPDH